MFSVADRLNLEGLNALLMVSGEIVRFRGFDHRVLIDRNLAIDALARGEIGFAGRDVSEVWFLVSQLDGKPQVGEALQDADGRWHRIRQMTSDRLTHRCICEVSDPP